MKKIFFIMFLMFSCNCFSKWHTWEEKKPKEGQLYMTVDVRPYMNCSERQIIIIRHYSEENKIYDKQQLWSKITIKEIARLFDEGSTVIYLTMPLDKNFLRRMEDLISK